MSASSTNWEYITEDVIRDQWTAHTRPINYGECNCGLSWKCIQSSEGMMAGCYALEALLQTTLQCFYDQNCVDSNEIFTKLNISTLETSRFKLNSTIQSILNNLMVEEYKSDLSYEKYFNECSPSSCSYSYVQSYDATQAIISLISLYGGFVIITRCLAIIIVKIYRHYKNRVTPVETIEQNT
ncbi:unnamed protein product [Rotaria sp. Silwood2]|nr:unnamed protein product [Rotaria sp. Silwood2]CAF4023158.1 unnamed protein product [Rotaria sp. Silwood2]